MTHPQSGNQDIYAIIASDDDGDEDITLTLIRLHKNSYNCTFNLECCV